MSYRDSFSAYGGGRASPFPINGLAERSFSDMFEYVSGDEGRGTRGGYPEIPIEADNDPDEISIRYLDTAFKVEFAPYAISESKAYVDEVRLNVARRLNEDPRRIRLMYKTVELTNDVLPLKSYGCKQNSEITVVVTSALNNYSPTSGNFREDDAVSLRPPSTFEGRRRANSSVRSRYSDDDRYARSPHTSGMLHPEDTYEPRPNRRRPSTSRPSVSRDPSPAPPRPSATPVPSSPRRPAHRNVDPNSPMGKVQTLADQFYDRWQPESRRFLSSPPSDTEARRKEYVRITESIMRHIIEAADAIEVGEDKDARTERKAVLNQAQDVLKRLDAAKSQW